jgi:solute carrier family 30 (zinc transporter), member 5/7
MKLSPLTIVLHTLFTGSYLLFFYEDVKEILGLESFKVNFRMSSESLVVDFVKTCVENEDTRKIAIFFTINLAFMFVELIYGYMSNSLGLISDSFHMLFDCMALFIGLCASYIAKLPSNKQYTYGFGRIETLSGLFNGIFLVFIAFNVFCESIERIFEPQKIETKGLLLVSVAGLGVNMIGLFFFHDHHHAPTEEGKSACNHDHGDNENMYGVFLHILADCLGSVGVIISSMLVKYYDMNVADPICSFLISLMILASSIPFIQLTANTLMMKASGPVKRRTNKMKQMFTKLDGVV